MSLKDIVKEIIRDMEEDDRPGCDILDRYVYALKKAVNVSDSHREEFVSPEVQNLLEIEKARVAIRKEREESDMREAHEGRIIGVIGGPHGGTEEDFPFHSIHPDMPESAHTLIGDQVYTLRNGKLYHDEEETQKYLNK